MVVDQLALNVMGLGQEDTSNQSQFHLLNHGDLLAKLMKDYANLGC